MRLLLLVDIIIEERDRERGKNKQIGNIVLCVHYAYMRVRSY